MNQALRDDIKYLLYAFDVASLLKIGAPQDEYNDDDLAEIIIELHESTPIWENFVDKLHIKLEEHFGTGLNELCISVIAAWIHKTMKRARKAEKDENMLNYIISLHGVIKSLQAELDTAHKY